MGTVSSITGNVSRVKTDGVWEQTRYLYKGMARHNASSASSIPGVSAHPTGVSTVSGHSSVREFGVAPSRGDGGGMSVLLSWHEKVSL
jgi:actin related protein 2/3 complex subunit 5